MNVIMITQPLDIYYNYVNHRVSACFIKVYDRLRFVCRSIDEMAFVVHCV